ncbi:hypothetical protein BsWGS_07010 [Bradybaena similaris]
MLFYAVFILLPASALAMCDDNTAEVFVDLVDANKDGYVNRTECLAAFHVIDSNDDQRCTLQEFKQTLPKLDPSLEGQEEALLQLLDIDKDGDLSLDDVDEIFRQADVDKDGRKSKPEYIDFLKRYC